MLNLLVDGNEVSLEARGRFLDVCAEELTAIDYLRNKLSEQMEISEETANRMIIESLKASLSIKE